LSYPPHRKGRRFFNPSASGPRGLVGVLRWILTRRPEPSPARIPVQPSIPPAAISSGLLVTFVNHSTVLLQQPGAHILTDPIWSARCSPVSFAGPLRHRAPGIDFDRLPPIHIVLLSHDHYDHLDLPTLRRLAAGPATLVAPLGVGRYLESHGVHPVRELDWGETVALSGATIHSVPAFHFSGRGLFDRDRTLWCGYMIESTIGLVYFAGDTGFGGHFSWIRDRFGPPRLALLPIGAYEPGWFMSPVHMNPDEALEAHRIVGATSSIAIHHGTFQLADESIDAPAQRLRSIAPESFLILDNGQSRHFSGG
jgi:L-ascorbate metabolism protein UlaG (beta-lactamase superfamily)